MKWIMEHFGQALLVAAVLVALGALIIGMLNSDGTIATTFHDSITSLFDDMSSITGSGAGAGM